MKKLLGLLAVTSLVASSSISVIACGKKAPVSTDDNILTTKSLIDEFIAEISTIIYNHLDSIRPNLMRNTSGNYNDFFTYENVKTYGFDNNLPERVPTPLTQVEKDLIINTFIALVNVINLKNEINKLATTTDKYNILINPESGIVNVISFDISSFSMNYVDAITFLASAKIPMVIKYSYLDYNKNIVSVSVLNDIDLTITDDTNIELGITKLENNLANDLLNNDNAAVWNKATDNGYTQTDLYKAFELYNDSKRLTKLNAIMGNEEWQTTLNEFITDQNYFDTGQNTEIKLNVSAKEIKSDKLISKIEPITHVSTPWTYTESLSLRQTFLQKYQANDDLNFISGTVKGDQEIYDILNGTFKESYTNLKTNMQTNMPDYAGTNLGKDNILLGETVIAGLALNFESLNFVLPLNTLRLSYSFSLTGNDFDIETNNTLDKSLLGEAVYKNTEAGIKSFQENFGIVDQSVSNYSTPFRNSISNQIENLRIPLIFRGAKLTNPLNINIFDELKKFNQGKMDTNNLDVWRGFNQIFSLNTNELSAVKYNLLNEGYQGNFSFGIKNIFRFPNYNYYQELETPGEHGYIYFQWGNYLTGSSSDNEFVTSSSSGFTYFRPPGFTQNPSGFNMGFELDLTLLSIFISLPEFNFFSQKDVPDNEIPVYVRINGRTALFKKY